MSRDNPVETAESRFSQKQRRVINGLALIGPGPSAYFQDACILIGTDPPMSSTTHLVAHLLREVESAVRAALSPLWSEALEGENNRERKHQAEVMAILQELGISEEMDTAKFWIALTAPRSTTALPRRAHRDNLYAPRPLDDEFRGYVDDFESLLDVVLDRFQARFGDILNELDRLVEKPEPMLTDAEYLHQNVPNNIITLDYFFEHANDTWLDPLDSAGYFRRPPTVVRNLEGTYSFPSWPESQYLVRVASSQPQVVADIASRIPETDNPRIHDDIAQIALAIPAAMAVPLIERIAAWLSEPTQIYLHLRVNSLTLHMLEGQQVNEALQIARAFLISDPVRERENEGKWGHRLMQPRTLLSVDDYQEYLEKSIPELGRHAGQQTLQLLCDALEALVDTSNLTSQNSYLDNSWIWRYSIDNDDHSRPKGAEDYRDLLVTALRDIAESLMADQPNETLVDLESRRGSIFQRLGLYLRRRWPEADPEGTLALVSDENILRNQSLQRDLDALLANQFGQFPSSVQSRYLTFIDAGGDRAMWETLYVRELGRTPEQHELDRLSRQWEYERLKPISNYLPADWTSRFLPLQEEFERLSEQDVVELLSLSMPVDVRVQEYQPTDLLREFSQAQGDAPPALVLTDDAYIRLVERVQGDPDAFAHGLQDRSRYSLKFSTALIEGFRYAVRRHSAFRWPPVLAFCHEAVMQSAAATLSESAEEQSDAELLRRTTVELLLAALQGELPLQIDLRNAIWQLLVPLSSDSSPTPADELGSASFLGICLRSATMTRSMAIAAIIQYGYWIARYIGANGENQSDGSPSSLAPTEIWDILETHLDLEREPSLIVHSVYGTNLPKLTFISNDWVTKHESAIFPKQAHLDQYRRAAWYAYLIQNRTHRFILPVIQSEFDWALQQIGTWPQEGAEQADIDQRLITHLMNYFWHGELSIDDETGVIRRLFEIAPADSRKYALTYLGDQLCKATSPIPQLVIERLVALWDYRLRACRDATASGENVNELSSFALWFASNKFPATWAMAKLKASLELTNDRLARRPGMLLLQQLAIVASEFPADSIHCLQLVIQRLTLDWQIHALRSEIGSILRNGLTSGDEGAHALTVEIIHRLAARGYIEFRQLLIRSSE